MKICVIGPTYPYRGGISHYTTLLYRHLRKRHDCFFISFKRQYPKWLYPGKSDTDISLTKIAEDNTKYLLDPLNPITWFNTFINIKKYNPELLIIQWWVSFWTPSFWTITKLVKLICNKKILFICHNVIEHESNLLRKICTKFVLNNGDHFIVHSNSELNNLRKIIPRCNAKVNTHPIYEIFNTRKIGKEEAKKHLNINGNILLFFGFIRKYKGLHYLIDAIPLIKKEIKEIKLIIAGEFWDDIQYYKKQIKRLEIKQQVIIYDEYIKNEEVEYYFAAADIVVLPYISATGSGIVQTAMGFDKPVITTNVGNLPEIVTDDKSGFIVETKNHLAITNAVITYYKKNKEKEFIRFIKNDKKRFSWDNMVEIIESLV